MTNGDRRTIEKIIAVNSLIDTLWAEIEDEQDRIIHDHTLPAIKAVGRLIELDNMRVDLCNLNVLYSFIERGLGVNFRRFCDNLPSSETELYEIAKLGIEKAGYTLSRAATDFCYLFKRIKRKKKAKLQIVQDNENVELRIMN